MPHSIVGVDAPPGARILRSSESGEIFVEGDSAEAAVLAIKHADCLILSPRAPDQMHADALPVLHLGKQVGVRGPYDPDTVAAYEEKGVTHFVIEEREHEAA